MSMKTVLVPTENDNAMRSALQTALHLARRCNSYIEGVALRRDVSELVGVDAVSGVWLDAYRHDLPNEEEQAREIFELFMQEHNVPCSSKTTVPPSSGWLKMRLGETPSSVPTGAARARRVGGTSSPSALAVFRLMIRSGRLTETEALQQHLVEQALASVKTEWATRWRK